MVARLLPAFRRAGLPVVALAPRRDPIRRSRLIDEFVPVPDDPGGRAAVFAQWGERAEPGDWFVPGSDDVLWTVLDNGLPTELQVRLLPVANTVGLAALDSKAAMAQARAEAGVRQPDWAATDDAAAVPALASGLGYPVVVKQARGRAGGAVQVLRGPHEPLRLRSTRSERGLLVERFVEGADVSVEALFLGGRLAVMVTSRVVASLGTHGVSVVREFVDCTDDVLVQDMQALGRHLGLDGFANVTARRDAEGRHWVFEVDMRPNSWHAYLPGIGVDLAAALRDEGDGAIRGLRLPRSPVTVRNLSRAVLYATSPRGARSIPRLLHRETTAHVHTGDWGLLPGDAARTASRWMRHVMQGVSARRR
jgi:hypothetical protein